MPTLLVLIPTRARGDLADAPGAAMEFPWVRSDDVGGLQAQGRAQAALLPRGDTVVAVLPAGEVGWQRLDLPRVASSRLREALSGALEDVVLEDPDQLHFALEPGASAGASAWVAVAHRPWLTQVLAVLEQGGVTVERIVPAWAPGSSWRGHFRVADESAAEGGVGEGADAMLAARLCLAGPQGVVEMPLDGALSRRLADSLEPSEVAWTASPAAVSLAERWLERLVRARATPASGSESPPRVDVLMPAELALRAAAGAWDLRQFDLALPRRGSRWFAQAWRQLRSPAWKPVRIGLVALLALQVVGLNAWAWHQERQIARLRQAQSALLQTAHPQVRSVLDAPLQMQRETERLRAAAGQPGPDDLEAALAAAAGAWPSVLGPARAVRFEPGRLTLSVAGWSAGEAQAFGERLRPSGWQAEFTADTLTLRRAAAGPTSRPRS
jgi:general secretion pathway protein L